MMKTIINNEIKSIFSSPWKATLFFIVPLVITVYFGVIFQDGIIGHARTVLVDQDGSSLSRSLLREFRSNRGFDIVWELDDVSLAEQLVHREAADVIVAVPPGFAADLKQGKSPALLLIADAGNMAISSNALKKANEIILTFSTGAEIQRLEGKGFLPAQAENIALPLRFQYRQVGNPSGSFYDFLLWGLIGAVGHFPMMLFAVTSLSKEEESQGSKTVLGKIAAYTLLGTTELLSCILLGTALFPLSFYGSIMALVLLTFVFALAIAAMGLFLSVIMPNHVLASQAGVVVVLPALLLSGHTWPLSGFPWFIKILGLAEPLTYYINPLRDLALSQNPGLSYGQGLIVLAVMAFGYGGAAALISGRRKKVAQWKQEILPS
ncbi:MAG: ABC transporter permease [Bacillota bacterium]|jgi:ABC-2 type transport system permease protein